MKEEIIAVISICWPWINVRDFLTETACKHIMLKLPLLQKWPQLETLSVNFLLCKLRHAWPGCQKSCSDSVVLRRRSNKMLSASADRRPHTGWSCREVVLMGLIEASWVQGGCRGCFCCQHPMRMGNFSLIPDDSFLLLHVFPAPVLCPHTCRPGFELGKFGKWLDFLLLTAGGPS